MVSISARRLIPSASSTRTDYVMRGMVCSEKRICFFHTKRCDVFLDKADIFLYYYIQKPYVLILCN